MKVIDLLNKIANGEEVPEKIKVGNIIWSFDKKEKTYFMNNTNIQLFYVEEITKKLNDEVEVIEEDKKIEKLENLNVNYCRDGKLYETLTKDQIALDISTLQKWVNKIIDRINEVK